MGREAAGTAEWQGQSGAVKALLESHEIILRGGIRARLARAGMAEVRVDGEALQLNAGGEPLTLRLGAGEAAKWAAALLKPLPALAEKLGIGPAARAFVIGGADDPELMRALAGATAATLDGAAVVIAVLRTTADLDTALAAARAAPAAPLWCIHGKGKAARPGDAAVRAFLRGHGLIDTKSCAVSERWTATRYGAARQRD